MYSTCLFCHAKLGANEAIEHFPVGRRLAFDAAKGRLWVVCRTCARWNLTPLETRWEAIEECERLYRDTRTRVATDNIGLARVREGATLVRIGNPLRPEMAAWRYGDQFGRRRRKYLAVAGASALAVGAVTIAGPLTGAISWAGALNFLNYWNFARELRAKQRLRLPDRVVKLSKVNLISVQIRPDMGKGFGLLVSHSSAGSFWGRWRAPGPDKSGSTLLYGNDAVRAARVLLPRINQAGGKPADIKNAVALLERSRSLDDMFTEAAMIPHHTLPARKRPIYGWSGEQEHAFMIAASLPAPIRLALEMALHEDDERRALEGELAELEQRWREAEEIAAISDNLLLPDAISERLKKARE